MKTSRILFLCMAAFGLVYSVFLGFKLHSLRIQIEQLKVKQTTVERLDKTVRLPYFVTVTGLTSLTIPAKIHGQGESSSVTAECAIDLPLGWNSVSCYYAVSDSGDVEFAWSPAFTGRVMVVSR